MSENENQPPAPSKQTSSVPLKKETVRVTLKAADAPPAVPSASVPLAPPVKPPIPTAPPVPTSSVAAARPPAPTVPLRTAGPPTAMAPAPTIRLAGAPGAATAPGVARPVAGAPTMALPKATVQLQKPTQPLAAASASSQPQSEGAEEENEVVEAGQGLANGLAIAGFIAALVVLYLQISTAGTWINAEDNENKGQWFSQLTN
jgi:hypothetical protein